MMSFTHLVPAYIYFSKFSGCFFSSKFTRQNSAVGLVGINLRLGDLRFGCVEETRQNAVFEEENGT